MGIGGSTDQGVVMTGVTGGAGNRHDTAMVWWILVLGLPAAGMTGRTVTGAQQGLTNRQAAQAAVGIMAAGAGVMGIGCSTVQGVVVTAATAGCGNLYQIAVIGNIGRVGAIEVAGVTAGAIATDGEVLTDRQADQGTVDVVTAGAGIVHLRISGIGQRWRIIVTVATAGRSNLNQAVVAWKVDAMGRFPTTGVTGLTVATASGNPGLQCRNRAVTEVTFT